MAAAFDAKESAVPQKGDHSPTGATVSETAGGIPDDAIGPEQRSVPEQLDLAETANAEAMAAKLQAEADDERWRGRRPAPRKPAGKSPR